MPERGCGSRQQGGVYLCVESSFFGFSIEHFLVDPPTPWEGGQLRAPMLVVGQDDVKHVVLGVGKEFYPYVPDFVEEARVLGVSKRIPYNFDWSQLTPGRSKLLLAHSRAIPTFPFAVEPWCPWERCTFTHMGGRSGPCPTHTAKAKEPHAPELGNLWSLSALQSHGKVHTVGKGGIVHELHGGKVTVTTPSVSYDVPFPRDFPYRKRKADVFRGIPPDIDRLTYEAGIVLRFTQFHTEFVNRKGAAPKDLAERVEKAGFKMAVVPE